MPSNHTAATPASLSEKFDAPVALVAAGGIALLASFCFYAFDLRQGLLALVGAGFGFVLYQAHFSFAGGWRPAQPATRQ